MRDEVVLVTGGSSGIGLATAGMFARAGARVWLAARDEERLRAAAAQLTGEIRTFPTDVSEPASVAALAEEIRERDGRLDVLVNSAGMLVLSPAAEIDGAMAARLMLVNYVGLVQAVNACLPLMRAGAGRSIVNLSSFVGRLTPPYFGAYSATKHAVQAYSHALRQELRPEGFHIGLVLPGPVASPMTEDLLDTPMYPVPFGVPVITPDDVARAIVRCVRRRAAEVTVPGRFGPVLRLAAAFPRLVDVFYRPYHRGRAGSRP